MPFFVRLRVADRLSVKQARCTIAELTYWAYLTSSSMHNAAHRIQVLLRTELQAFEFYQEVTRMVKIVNVVLQKLVKILEISMWDNSVFVFGFHFNRVIDGL